MTQPHRGPGRAGVNDLRNIVDRLDLLMGSSASGTADAQGGGATSEQLEAVLGDLSDRIKALEDGLEELRTLVNHLMTIATWQAKVTATLVEDEAEAEEVVVDEDEDLSVRNRPHTSEASAQPEAVSLDAEQYPDHGEPRMPPGEPSYGGQLQDPGLPAHPATLDDDIDEILGTNRDQSGEQVPPPDFGI